MEFTREKTLETLRALTPVKTGRMKGSWLVDVGDRSITIQNFAKSRYGTMYAGFIDQGTSKIKPRLITDQALKQAMGTFTDRLGELLAEKYGGTRTKSSRDFAVAIGKLAKRETAIGVTRRTPTVM
jgi:hypothetical protein